MTDKPNNLYANLQEIISDNAKRNLEQNILYVLSLRYNKDKVDFINQVLKDDLYNDVSTKSKLARFSQLIAMTGLVEEDYINEEYKVVKEQIEKLTKPSSSESDKLPESQHLESTISNIEQGYYSKEEARGAITDFIEDYPEIFGLKNLENKIFTFTETILPIKPILAHILTKGAYINIIPYSSDFYDYIKTFIQICTDLKIIDAKRFNIIDNNKKSVKIVSRRDYKKLGTKIRAANDS